MSSEEKPKLGAGHLAAMGRQGLAELRAALYPESNVAQPPGPGIYGTSTQREVYEARHEESIEHKPDPAAAGEERSAQSRARSQFVHGEEPCVERE